MSESILITGILFDTNVVISAINYFLADSLLPKYEQTSPPKREEILISGISERVVALLWSLMGAGLAAYFISSLGHEGVWARGIDLLNIFLVGFTFYMSGKLFALLLKWSLAIAGISGILSLICWYIFFA